MELKKGERIDDLEFDNLKIIQNKDGFCFGIDAILLSNFAKNIKKDAIVCDIGSGTGIISILLSRKTKLAKVYGIEVQEEVAEMSKRSIILNMLQEKVEIINENINNIFNFLNKNSIDVIVTNPPYKKNETGLKSIEEKKLISRHEILCTLEDIIEKSSLLLKNNGEFYMVHKVERLADILELLRKYKLEPKNIRFVHSKANEAPNLLLIKAVKCGGKFLKIDKPLIVYNEDGTYTDEIFEIYDKKR